MRRLALFVSAAQQKHPSWWGLIVNLVYGPPPPSRWQLMWSRVWDILSYLFHGIWITASWIGHCFSWIFSSTDLWAIVVVIVLAVFCCIILIWTWKTLKFVCQWVWKKLAKWISKRSFLSINQRKKDGVVTFGGKDGDLLRRITIRNSSCSKRITSLLEAFEDQRTEEGRVKSDLVLRTLFEQTGCQAVPQNDDLWDSKKALSVWEAITDAIQNLSAKGETMTPRDSLRRAMWEGTSLNLLVVIEKAKTVYGSIKNDLSEEEALEIIVPRLPFAFLPALADVPFEQLTLDILEKRAKNWERLRMIWTSAKNPVPNDAKGKNFTSNPSGQKGRTLYQPRRHGAAYPRPQAGMRCANCREFGHSARDCPLPRAKRLNINETRNNEPNDHLIEENSRRQDIEPVNVQQPVEDIQEDAPEVFPDEGSTVLNESRVGSINVFSVTKQDNPFVAKKIHVSFQFEQPDKKYSPLRCLIDTGSCANLIPLKLIQGLGYTIQDVQKDHGEPKTLSGFNGSCTDTLGCITFKIRLGSTTRQATFLVVPDCISSCILGMPALSAFGVNVNTRDRILFFSKK